MIGAGRIGRVHAFHLAQNPLARLTTVADAFRERAVALAAEHGGDVDDPGSVLDRDDVDAVYVCTPASTHLELASRALATGKYVFCEKPLALDPGEVKAFGGRHAADVHRMTVGFHRHFDGAHRRLRAEVEAGAVGRPEQILAVARDPELPSYEVLAGTGGIFKDMTIHDLEFVLSLLPEPVVAVHAVGRCCLGETFRAHGDYDTATVTLWTAGEVTATIINGRRHAPGFLQEITVFGSDGTLRLDNAPNVGVVRADRTGLHRELHAGHIAERYQEAYGAQCRHFLATVEKRGAFAGNVERAGQATALAEAARRSAAGGTVVGLDEVW